MLTADKKALNSINYESEVELKPIRLKSFCGKAKMLTAGNGYQICKSYNTIVAMKCPNGDFIRMWDGYSATTMNHVDSFCSTVGIPQMSKSRWDKMEIGKRYSRSKILEMR